MMRTLFLISVFLFGFTSPAAAQGVDFAFPSDVFGFSFGDTRVHALRNCRAGENYNENVFVCHRPVTPLGFEGDVYIEFASNNLVQRVWIESNPDSDLMSARRNYEIFRDDLVSRFGTADIVNNAEFQWVFTELHEEGEISIAFHMSDNMHGYFRLMFNANP